MVDISIICLVYKSTQLAEALYESVLAHTPLLQTGRAEFFFVANDPTEEVVEFLKAKKIPHYINMNDHLTEEELFSKGFAAPEYMRRVYQGYNYGIQKAKGQRVVLINSDNFFSRDWLENLLKYADYTKVVSSTLIEPGQENVGIFPFAIEKNFGRTLDDYDDSGFQSFAEKISKTGYSSGGAYMPCVLYKDIAIMAGLYPEGNIAGDSFNEVARFGDEAFYDKLAQFGVEHITAKDSIVYHLKEGEKSEQQKNAKPYKAKTTEYVKFNQRLVVHPAKLMPYIIPEVKHTDVINNLGKKLTVLILNPVDADEIDQSLATIYNFSFKNIETVLISSNKSLTDKYKSTLKALYVKDQVDKALYDLFHTMYGEHLLVINNNCTYDADLFDRIDDRSAVYHFGPEVEDGNLITEYMGHFLFPKRLLLSKIPTFLGFLVEKDKIEVDFSEPKVVNVFQGVPAASDVEAPQPHRSVPRRVVDKVKNDGVLGLAAAVKNKVRKR
jgi:hypothetical protein